MGLDYRKHRAWAENLQIVMQLGLTMAGCILFCFFTGRYIDRWLGARGIVTTLALLFGIIGGGVVCYRQILDITAEAGRHDDQNNGNTP